MGDPLGSPRVAPLLAFPSICMLAFTCNASFYLLIFFESHNHILLMDKRKRILSLPRASDWEEISTRIDRLDEPNNCRKRDGGRSPVTIGRPQNPLFSGSN